MNKVEREINAKSATKAEGYVGAGLPVEYHGEYGPIIDLGLATNPSGAAIESKMLYATIITKKLEEYDRDVNHTDIKKLLIDGIGLHGIMDKSVIFDGNGSYGAGDEVIRALSHHLSVNGTKPKLYVPTYSFSNVAQYAARHRIIYEPLPPGKTLFQEDSLTNVLDMGLNALKNNIVYVDYPNNPSGKANSELIRQVVSHVSENKGVPFVDLAFGEVLGNEFEDIIQFVINHQGICVGSLTKTQGLPSLRAGYIIMGPTMTYKLYNDETRLVFGLPVQTKRAYKILFEKNEHGETLAKNYAKKAAQYNIETNTIFYQALQDLGLWVAPTNLETPIQIIVGEGNIYKQFARAGIKTESLNDYKGTLPEGIKGYGDSAVRMLTPRIGTLEETISRLKIAVTLPA